MKKLLLLLSLSLLAFTSQAGTVNYTPTMTSGTATVAVTSTPSWIPGGISGVIKVTVTWTAATSGTVYFRLPLLHGHIGRVVTNPGSPAPTDNYDLTILDEDGADLLNTDGQDRDTANTEQTCPLVEDRRARGFTPVVFYNQAYFKILNAGSAKAGIVTLYIYR